MLSQPFIEILTMSFPSRFDGKFHRSRMNDRAIFGNESDSGAGLHGRSEQRADGRGSNKCLSDFVFHFVVFGVMRYSDLEREDPVILEQELTQETESFIYLCSLSFLLLNLGADVRFGGAASVSSGLQLELLELLRCRAEVAELVNGRARGRKGERFKRFLEHFVEVSPRGEAGCDVRMIILAGMLRHELRNVGD